ncbi:MAG: hypothetical protein KDH94_05910, partial [Coxiellaceae bacterium]|nr:hypothetical protein [Coxiellaceae bacterium]
GVVRTFDTARDNHLVPEPRHDNLAPNPYGEGQDGQLGAHDGQCDDIMQTTVQENGARFRERICIRYLENPHPAQLPRAIRDIRVAKAIGDYDRIQDILNAMPYEYRDDLMNAAALQWPGNHPLREQAQQENPAIAELHDPYIGRVIERNALAPRRP